MSKHVYIDIQKFKGLMTIDVRVKDRIIVQATCKGSDATDLHNLINGWLRNLKKSKVSA